MKNKYKDPIINIEKFYSESIITASGQDQFNADIQSNIQNGNITVDGQQLNQDAVFVNFAF